MTAKLFFDPADLRRLRERADLHPLVGKTVPLRRDGAGKWKGLCPFHAERSPSFYVWRDHFHCFGCGAHGDAIGWLRQRERLDFQEAVQQLAAELGMALASVPAAERKRPALPVQAALPPPPGLGSRGDGGEDLDRLVATWREAARLTPGDPVLTYLGGRALDAELLLPWLGSLHYAPALPYWHDGKMLGAHPAMLALIQDHRGHPLGLHATYLMACENDAGRQYFAKLLLPDSATRKPGEAPRFLPAKKVRGRAMGGAIRFGQPTEHLIGGEGIETSLSALDVMLASGKPGCGEAWSVWALVSLGNFAGPGQRETRPRLHPEAWRVDDRGRRHHLPSPLPGDGEAFRAPGIVKRFTWIEDRDGKDPASGRMLVARGCERLRRAGIDPDLLRPAAGMDLNRQLQLARQRGQGRAA